MVDRMPLMLLPGLLCDAGLWTHQIRNLTDLSALQVADLTCDDNMVAMAQRVLAHAPDRFALAALSMGGYVAFEILRQAPERVIRLALIDTSAAPDTAAQTEERRRAIEDIRRLGRFVGVTARTLSRLVHPDHVEGPIGQTVRDMATRVGREAFIQQQQAIISRPDSRALLSTITVPTMIVVGAQDRVTPLSEAEAMHAGINGSVLRVIEQCGHLAPLEKPQATTLLMRDWLSGVSSMALRCQTQDTEKHLDAA